MRGFARSPKRPAPPPITVCGDVAFISLTRGMVATIDAADAHLVEGLFWGVITGSKTFYAVTTDQSTKRILSLHRLLLNAPPGTLVDHEDRDGLNCRRANIRFATRSLNAHNSGIHISNTSGAKGVIWRANRQRWIPRIVVNGKRRELGSFINFDDAVRAREDAFKAILKELE